MSSNATDGLSVYKEGGAPEPSPLISAAEFLIILCTIHCPRPAVQPAAAIFLPIEQASRSNHFILRKGDVRTA